MTLRHSCSVILRSAAVLLLAVAPGWSLAAPPAPVAVPIDGVPPAVRPALRAHTGLQGPDEGATLDVAALRRLAAWGLEHVVLSNPGRTLQSAGSWSSRAVFHWLRDVRACQPSFVPEAERYDGYPSYDDCAAPEQDKWMAFVLARLPRSPHEVQQMWDAVGEATLAHVSPEAYAASGARDTVDVLRRAHARVVVGRDEAALSSLYAEAAAHECRTLDRELLGDEVGDLGCWGTSFWLRRHHEGNLSVVAGIVDAIAERYALDVPADAVYVQGTGVRLRAAAGVHADPVAVLTIGEPCGRLDEASGWVHVRCRAGEGWVFGTLVAAAPPSADAALAAATARQRPADERLQMALRASALHPDHDYPSGVVVRTFREIELARVESLEEAQAPVRRTRTAPCVLDTGDGSLNSTGSYARRRLLWRCFTGHLLLDGAPPAVFAESHQGSDTRFVAVTARNGELRVTSGRVWLSGSAPRYEVRHEGSAGSADSVLAERLLEHAERAAP